MPSPSPPRLRQSLPTPSSGRTASLPPRTPRRQRAARSARGPGIRHHEQTQGVVHGKKQGKSTSLLLALHTRRPYLIVASTQHSPHLESVEATESRCMAC